MHPSACHRVCESIYSGREALFVFNLRPLQRPMMAVARVGRSWKSFSCSCLLPISA